MSKELRNKIVKTLKDSNFKIATTKLEKMHNMLTLDEHQETKLKEFLVSINIPEDVVGTVVDTMLLRFKNLEKFCDYIENRDIDIRDHLDKVIDLPKMFEARGIDPELIRWLINLTWRTTPPSGVAEAAIAILFKDARKPIPRREYGDVVVDDSHIEVKGRCGVLVGPKAYGDAPSVGLYLIKRFSELAGKKLTSEPGDFNLYRAKPWYLEELTTSLIVEGKMTSDDAIDIMAEALLLLYIKSKKYEIKKWLKPCINDVGVFDKKLFWEKFFIFSYKYYHKVEAFDYMVLCDSDRIFIFNPNHIKRNVKHIKITGIPTWKANAAVQGRGFGVSLR